MLGHVARLHGTAAPGQRVAIERLDARRRQWVAVASASAGADGRYVASWRTDHVGLVTVRAVPAAAAVQAAGAPATVELTILRAARATWYGPGLYGRRTACGIRLTSTLVGVAHRGLPCGRTVALYYRGRSIVAPVVDRGPFDNGAEWDLTTAAAKALGFARTDTIGAASLPATAPPTLGAAAP
jgi:rare lipoprotein A (peptidoglycan hydrolase)